VWIVVSRPRTDSELQDWKSAAFFGPFEDEKTARTFARERDAGKEEKLFSFGIELVDPRA
jgi:hypothetical protein